MKPRIEILEDVLQMITGYTRHEDGYRPGLVDLMVFDIMINLHIQDEENSDYIWENTPDHLMEIFIEDTAYPTLQFGTEDLEEQVRNWLIFNKHIKELGE